MQTISPAIYRQRILPAKINQQMLPPITADTTQIHKMIEETYGKTEILPETHTYHVTNYDENTSKEMIKSFFPQNPVNPVNTVNTVNTQPQPTLVQSSFYQPVLVTYKPVIYNSINPNYFQPILQRRMILMTRNAPILSSINLPYSSATF